MSAAFTSLSNQVKYICHLPSPRRITNFARRPNCNGVSLPVLIRVGQDRSHYVIGPSYHITSEDMSATEDITAMVYPLGPRAPRYFILSSPFFFCLRSVPATGVTVIWVSPSFGHPRTQIPSDMGIPGRDAQNTDSIKYSRLGQVNSFEVLKTKCR